MPKAIRISKEPFDREGPYGRDVTDWDTVIHYDDGSTRRLFHWRQEGDADSIAEEQAIADGARDDRP